MPRFPKPVIFVVTDDDDDDNNDRQNCKSRLLYPCACMRDKNLCNTKHAPIAHKVRCIGKIIIMCNVQDSTSKYKHT